VGHQRDRDLRLSEKVVKDREHLLFCLVVLFEAWHCNYFLQLLLLVVAEVEQQVIAVVCNDRSQEPVHLFVGDFHFFFGHGVPEDTLPDVVVVLEQVSYKRQFVASLVPFLVLDQRDEVSRVQSDWHVALARIPVALILRNANIPLSLVLLEQNLLEDKRQIVQRVDRFIIRELDRAF